MKNPTAFQAQCSNCRWWDRSLREDCEDNMLKDEYPGITCDDMRREWGDCILTRWNDEDINGEHHHGRVYPNSRAMAYGSYNAGLTTHMTFYCNQWEQPPNE